MTVAKQIIRRSDLTPTDLKILLPAEPSPQAIEQLKHHLDCISTKLLERSNLCEGTRYIGLAGGVLTLLAAVSTGGIGAGVCAVVSGIGTLSAWWHSGEIAHQSEELLEFTVKLSNLIEGTNSTRLAGLWQLVGSDGFWQFLNATVAASDEYADGLRVKARVNGRVKLLDPNQGTCYRFAETYGMTPEDLLTKLGELEKTLPSVVTVPIAALPPLSSGIPTPVSPVAENGVTAQNQGFQASIEGKQGEIPKAPTAYSVLVGNPFLSRAGFGAQRSGKSYLLAVATQELALERGVQIFHINLASYGDEDSRYWGHAVRSVRCDLPSLDSYQAQHFTEKAIECVYQFFATRNAILVFDEIILTGAISNQHSEIVAPLLKLVADKISCLASTGIKRGQAIWTASPDFVAGACTQDCKALKSLSICYVAIAPGKSVAWNGNPVKFHQESFENIKRNFPSLTYPEGKWKGERICFVDGQWRELGELPRLQESAQKPQPITVNTDDIAQKLETLYERSESLPSNPIADWDNGYQATGDALLEVLEFIRSKYGTDPVNPSDVHRSQTSIRKLYDGKVDNLKALLLRAIQEELAILDSDDKGNPVLRVL